MKGVSRPITALAMLVLAGACAAPQEQPGARAADWPDFEPPQAGETVYRVDRERSLLLVRVDPAGPMARLGHSHIVGGPVISGRLVAGPGAGRVDVRIDAAGMDVDRPEWRRAHGLKPDLDPDAVAGTKSNMNGERVLDTAEHPEIAVRSVASSGPAWLPELTIRVRLRGRVAEFKVPVSVQREDGRIRAAGAFDVHHADFGLEPFSAAGGALRVADRIRIRFRIVAVADAGDVAIIAGHSTKAEIVQ